MSPRRRSSSPPFTAALLALVAMTQWTAPAWAYRPFDGTDAAFAESGELEIEFQPVGILQQGSDKTLIAPATVVNIGLPDRWEAVFQGQGQLPLSTSDQPAGAGNCRLLLQVSPEYEGPRGRDALTHHVTTHLSPD